MKGSRKTPSWSSGTPPESDQDSYYFERVLTGDWVYVAALAASFVVATLASPAGVSGAVLLLPFQVGVLGTPSPSVTPTNLLYNVVATPGALYRYWRQGQTGGRLTRLLIFGTLPGVVAGSVIRVEFLPGETSFEVVIACVLIPLGAWILVFQRPPHQGVGRVHAPCLWPSLQRSDASAVSTGSAAGRSLRQS